MSSGQSVVVIGGGLAGAAAALALAKHGVQVTLFEARRRLGGRTGSFTPAGSSEAIDYCQHVGMGCCTNLRKWIDWLGQSEDWETQRELHFYGPTGNYQRLAALPMLPAPLHLATWWMRWPGLGMTDRVAVARGMLAIQKVRLGGSGLDVIACDWLKQNGQTPRAIEHFWHTIIVSALGEELHRVHLDAVAKVLQDGFLNHRDAFHLIVPKRPLGELFGSELQRALSEAGVTVQMQTRVQRVARVEDDLTSTQRYRLQLDSQEPVASDAVVVAVPWFRFAELFSDSAEGQHEKQLHEEQLRSVQTIAARSADLPSSPISGIHTWWDRPWLDTPHATIVGRLCQWVFPKKGAVEPQNGEHYYQIVVSASRGLPRGNATELERLVREDLQAIFPKVAAAKLLRMQVVTDPQAVFSIGTQSHAMRPSCVVPGTNLFLAGDWIQTGWPATMEGAIKSGFQAAEAILETMGRRVAIVAPPLGK